MPADPRSSSLTQRVTTAHGEIAWDRAGEGPPVVLVHGTPSRSVLWRSMAPVLAERYTVYVFDMLGFGDSERYQEQEVSVRIHGEVLAELARGWDLDGQAPEDRPAQVTKALVDFLS